VQSPTTLLSATNQPNETSRSSKRPRVSHAAGSRACECQSEADFEFRPLYHWHAIDDAFAPSPDSAGLRGGAPWLEIAPLHKESERAVVRYRRFPTCYIADVQIG